jgi:hypothetical protein
MRQARQTPAWIGIVHANRARTKNLQAAAIFGLALAPLLLGFAVAIARLG